MITCQDDIQLYTHIPSIYQIIIINNARKNNGIIIYIIIRTQKYVPIYQHQLFYYNYDYCDQLGG